MKKLLHCFCAMALSLGAFAQKGKSEVGINVDLAPTFSTDPASLNLGIGAKYRYNMSNRFRLDANFTYYFNSLSDLHYEDKEVNASYDKIKMFDISLNVHYLCRIGEKITVYPLAGLGYINVSPNWYVKSTGNQIGNIVNEAEAEKNGPAKHNIVLNLGGGFEYAITDHISANAEIKFPILVDINPMPISLGVTYKF